MDIVQKEENKKIDKEEYIYVLADVADLIQLSVLLLPIFNAEFQYPYQYNSSSFLVTWIDNFRTDNHVLIVAKEADRVVGGIGFMLIQHPFNEVKLVAQELFWYVLPDKRSSLIGRNLLHEAEVRAKSMGAKQFNMVAIRNSSFENLSKFYNRNGYTEIESAFSKDLLEKE